MIQLFPLHVVVFVEFIQIRYQKGILDHWGSGGGRCSILDLLIWEREVAIFKLSYSYTLNKSSK